MSKVASVEYTDYKTSVCKALDLIRANDVLPQTGLIVLKPNLTTSSPPPVTTPVACVRAVLEYCREHSLAEIAIGEGCGSGRTLDLFDVLGYTDLAEEFGVELIDFNTSKAVRLEEPNAIQEKEFFMPEVLVDAFVVSIPILKDHSFTQTTVAMKNMFGIAPSSHYSGSWNKSQLHSPSTDAAVHDLCLYKCPGLSVVDARVALTGMHLAGTPRTFNRILAGVDPVAVDTVGSRMLGHNPEHLEYLVLSDGKIGTMSDIELIAG